MTNIFKANDPVSIGLHRDVPKNMILTAYSTRPDAMPESTFLCYSVEPVETILVYMWTLLRHDICFDGTRIICQVFIVSHAYTCDHEPLIRLICLPFMAVGSAVLRTIEGPHAMFVLKFRGFSRYNDGWWLAWLVLLVQDFCKPKPI